MTEQIEALGQFDIRRENVASDTAQSTAWSDGN